MMHTPDFFRRYAFRLQVLAYRFRQLFRRRKVMDSGLVGIHTEYSGGNGSHFLVQKSRP